MLQQKTLLIDDLISSKLQNECNFAAYMSPTGKDLFVPSSGWH